GAAGRACRDEVADVAASERLVRDDEEVPDHLAPTGIGRRGRDVSAKPARADSTAPLSATSEPSTNSDASPSGSHQLPMSSARPGRPTVRDQTNAASAPAGSSSAPSQPRRSSLRTSRAAEASEPTISAR